MSRHLLILNNGSSSLKFSVFALGKELGNEVLTGSFSLYGQKSVLTYSQGRKKTRINYQSAYDLSAWWRHLLGLLTKFDIAYVGFRLVHGGEEFNQVQKIDKNLLTRVKKYNQLAPLHNPTTLALVQLAKQTWPRAKMALTFDTAWHRSMAPEAYLYSLPLQYYKNYGIRKYGFHGLSHEAAALYAAKKLGKSISQLSLISCHLGSGSSLAWVVNGKVKDTTMGFSPNEGLTMATRSGDLPSGVVLYMARELKIPLKEIDIILNKQSGLLGLSGLADLRDVLLAAGYRVADYKSSYKFNSEQRKMAKTALAVYVYDIRRYLASYLAMSKKLETIVFGGTVSQNKDIRRLVLKDLNLPKGIKIFIAPEGEMKNIAQKTIQCLKK
ncbi:MAG: hypothetical protein PHO91_03555 [Patescibacteria group bacterium]|nr:hypothetical protein [Patescibacteria group bacterium]